MEQAPWTESGHRPDLGPASPGGQGERPYRAGAAARRGRAGAHDRDGDAGGRGDGGQAFRCRRGAVGRPPGAAVQSDHRCVDLDPHAVHSGAAGRGRGSPAAAAGLCRGGRLPGRQAPDPRRCGGRTGRRVRLVRLADRRGREAGRAGDRTVAQAVQRLHPGRQADQPDGPAQSHHRQDQILLGPGRAGGEAGHCGPGAAGPRHRRGFRRRRPTHDARGHRRGADPDRHRDRGRDVRAGAGRPEGDQGQVRQGRARRAVRLRHPQEASPPQASGGGR